MHNLTNKELATVLVALRFWQKGLEQDHFPIEAVKESWPQFDDADPLSLEEVDELCERLNIPSGLSKTELNMIAEAFELWIEQYKEVETERLKAASAILDKLKESAHA